MLKIKDNVDLKELYNYGFKKELFIDEIGYSKEYKLGRCYREAICIWEKDKSIQVQGIIILNDLYDLIKADLVEKVDD